MNRLLGGLVAAVAILLLAVVPVAAGGWSSITPDEGSATAEPVVGEPVDLGFTVLQHAQTPAPWVSASVVLSNALTGAQLTEPARATDESGHFVATVNVPEAGVWTWRVQLAELETDDEAFSLPVRTADGRLPAVGVATAVGLVEQAKREIREELRTEYAGRLDALQQRADAARTTASSMAKRVAEEVAARESLQARVDGLPGGTESGGLPLIGVVTIAVLAAAVTAFAMLLLARPSRVASIPPVAPERGEAAGEPPAAGFATTR
jgi:hypothetical protein